MVFIVSEAIVLAVTSFQFIMVNAMDWIPKPIKRRLLAKKYSGETLELRLNTKIGGGLSVWKGIYRISSINMKPSVKAGDVVPKGISVERLIDSRKDKSYQQPETFDLASLAPTGKRIVVVNFGSCS